MKPYRTLCIVTLVSVLQVLPAWAGGWQFVYKLKPGQTWTATMNQQNTFDMMGEKQTDRRKTVLRYTVAKGQKSGWVSITAKINQGAVEEGGPDLGKLTFTADLHATGEIRNKRVTGSAAPPMPDTAGMPPEMKAMMAQSYQSIGEMWKEAVFWFPEFPEEKLDIGDEFETTQKMGDGGGAMGMEAAIKQVFTLEDVSDGLAYFSVRQRGVTKTAGMGAKTDTKTAGKGETIFDLKEGMWVEVVTRSQSSVNMGAIPGMAGGTQKMQHMTKIAVERH